MLGSCHLTCCRRLSKLSKEIESFTQHKLNVTDALRRSIRLNAKLSSNHMRAAIGKVLDMVPVLPYENEEPASNTTRGSADREECVTSSAAFSTELDFFSSSFDTTTAIQMLGDIGPNYGYYEDLCHHSVTTFYPKVPFPFPMQGRDLVDESMPISGSSGGSVVMEGFGSQSGVVYAARGDLGISQQPSQETGLSPIFTCT